MKLVYISKSIIPSRSANSIHVMKMCEAFARSGHTVLLLAPRRGDNEPGIKDPFTFYGVDPSFELRKLPGRRISFISKGYGMLAALSARYEHADLVYSRHLNGCLYAGWLGMPFIYECHAPHREGKPRAHLPVKTMLRSRNLKKVVVISRALREYLHEQFGNNIFPIEIIPDAADDTGYTSEANPFIRDNRLQVGYTGQLYPGRGIEIIYQLAQLCPWAVFHVLGGSEKDIANWRQKVNGSDNLIFHGFIPPAEINRYRPAFDILLAPYQKNVSVSGGGGDTSRWMSPLKLFEYMSAGKAIVCSDLPVLREILTDDVTALLCPPESTEHWRIALHRLRDDVSLRRRLGEAARRTFLQKHTWTDRAQKVLNLEHKPDSYD
jgi:glycosyltransferase involved in cell wall biosynthesis